LYPQSKSRLIESIQAFLYLFGADPLRTFFYCGAVPFGIIWILRQSVPTAFALQAYCVTTLVFVDNPFRTEKRNIKQWWFWRAIFKGGAVIHPFVLAGMWRLDVDYPTVAKRGTGVFSIIVVAGVLELIILGMIVDRARSVRQDEAKP
jgi:hypothetical protein